MSETTAIPGPWVAETGVTHYENDNGLAVLAILPEFEGTPEATPTRGMVAWVHSGLGSCETDGQAIATAKLIAAAPDMADALLGLIGLVQLVLPTLDEKHRFEVGRNHRLTAAFAALEKAGVGDALRAIVTSDPGAKESTTVRKTEANPAWFPTPDFEAKRAASIGLVIKGIHDD